MAASKATRLRLDSGPPPEDHEPMLVALRERLREEGAVRVAAIKPRALKESLVERLLTEGFELGGAWLRRPVLEQVREVLGTGALVTQQALSGRVRGVTAAELGRAVAELEAGGALHRVMHGLGEAVVAAGAQVLERDALTALGAAVAQLHGVLGAAGKKGVTLLASDVEAALGEMAGALGGVPVRVKAGVEAVQEPSHAGSGSAATLGLLDVLDALDAERDERSGLSFVPHLVQRLLPRSPVAAVHAALLAAAREERIELRPEGGLARLSSEELALCPPGPGGTRLSWARRMDADT